MLRLLSTFIFLLIFPSLTFSKTTGVPEKAFLNVYRGIETSLAGTPHALAPSLILKDKTPYVIWSEIDRSGFAHIHVRHKKKDRWILDGKYLNVSKKSYGMTPRLFLYKGKVYATWSEIVSRDRALIYVKQWDGHKWIKVGKVININPAERAIDPVLASDGKYLYIAWSELDPDKVSQIYVKRWDGKAWELLSGSVNINKKRHAFSPFMVGDGRGRLYIAWSEYSDIYRILIYVKYWNGTGWESLGGPINLNKMRHAIIPSLVVTSFGPYIAWAENDNNNIFQLHVKRWNGKKWVLVGKDLNINPSLHATSPVIIKRGNIPYIIWIEGEGQVTPHIYIKYLSQGKWRLYNIHINSHLPAAPAMVGNSTALYVAFSETDKNGIYRLYVKRIRKESKKVIMEALSQIQNKKLSPKGGRIFFTEIPGKETAPPPLAYKYLPKTALGEVDWMRAIRNGLLKPFDSTDPDAPPSLPPLNMDFLLPLKKSFNIPGVIFPHSSHTMWLDCDNCHPSIFIPKKGMNPITMHRVIEGDYCGRCHGVVAFRIYDCFRCHSASQ